MWLWLLLSFLLVIPRASATNEPIQLVVVDQSKPGSPLEVKGTVLLEEILAANEAMLHWRQNVVVKNVSDKSILLVVGKFLVTGHHSSGEFPFSVDWFFSEETLQPGKPIPQMGKMRGSSSVSSFNPLDKADGPRAEFRLLFVQFDDGSSFGNPAEADGDFIERAKDLDFLRRLAGIYALHGEQEFQAQLEAEYQADSTQHTGSIELLGLHKIEKEKGIGAAITRVRRRIAVAEAREAMLRPTAAH